MYHILKHFWWFPAPNTQILHRWHLRKGSNNLTYCIPPILFQVTPPIQTHVLCCRLTELLWDHILHSPTHCFYWHAVYLESTFPLSSLVQNLLPPSRAPYDSSSRKVAGPLTGILSYFAFLRQVPPSAHMTFICVHVYCATGFSFCRAETAPYSPSCSHNFYLITLYVAYVS